MVFFTCNACNESLKKNQVEKHYTTKCRRCEFLSCVDCGKEFWGDSYQTHTKCISEEEKYSGKNFVAKPNKGEVKQGQWIQKVQAAIEKAPANPQLKNLLQRLEDFPNVPRKKTKFENFLKCSLRVTNKGLVDQVWELLMAQTQQQNGNGVTNNGEAEPETTAPSSEAAVKPSSVTEPADSEDKEAERKLSKRERKENRQKKMHKAEKKDRQNADAVTEEEDVGKKKKGKRRKREEEEEEEEGEENAGREEEVQPKKKKRKVQNPTTDAGENGSVENGAATEDVEENGGDESSQDDTMTTGEHRGKFNWGKTITAVLTAKGEISVKRLQKKVLAEYASYGSSKPEERLQAKFSKKLSKMPNVKVLKDKAKLVPS